MTGRALPSVPVHVSTVLAPLVLELARSTPASAAYMQGHPPTLQDPPGYQAGFAKRVEVGPFLAAQKRGNSP